VGVAACAPDTLPPTNSGNTVAEAKGGNGVGEQMRFNHKQVCPAADVGAARCHAWVRIDDNGDPLATAGTPSGYAPADLQAAYKLAAASGSNGFGQTIAIVDAMDDPNAATDLAVYRTKFNLSACTTANGCFRKVDQTGGTHYPRADAGWSEEISLDLDMASAICPNCHILLVEATSSSFANLGAAVDQAAHLGANVISNSYGGSEYSTETTDQAHFNHSGIAITVSSGDAGYGVEFPASSQYVTAVGGTSLTQSSNSRGFTETAWVDAGSGCSKYITKPSWQRDIGCAKRTVADVSAVADPNTGVAVYDTYGIKHGGGWLVFGGTSVAAPLVGAIYALAGNEGSFNYGSFSYTNLGSIFDITSGTNGRCAGSYLCTAVTGYDGPTGNGTPNGVTSF
jgi:subtilase family serine protease